MRFTLTRSGGFAGVRRPPLALDTAAVPPAKAKEGHSALTAAGFFDLPTAIKGKPQPDRFSYELEVQHDDGRTHKVAFGEADASKELLKLVRWVESAAKK
jgi:hypothetical protein